MASDLLDAAAVDRQHLHRDVLVLNPVAERGHLAQLAVDETAQGIAAFVRQFDAQQLVHLVDRDACIKQVLVGVDSLNRRFFRVVLVLDLADNLFEQILNGDEARGSRRIRPLR